MEEKKYKKFNILEVIWGIVYSFILYYLTYLMLDDNFLENFYFFGYLLKNLIQYPLVGYLIIFNIFIIIKT